MLKLIIVRAVEIWWFTRPISLQTQIPGTVHGKAVSYLSRDLLDSESEPTLHEVLKAPKLRLTHGSA